MFDLPPVEPGVEIQVSSHGVSKGIEQVDGPQFIPRAYLQTGDLQVGGQWKNVTSTSAAGEASAFLNFNRSFGTFVVTAGAAYKVQTGTKGSTDSESFEFTGGLARKFGRVSLKVTSTYSPDDLGGTKQSLYVEGGPAFDLTKTLRLSANLGRRTRENAPDYVSMNFGATKTLSRDFSVDLRYYRTNRAKLGDVYRQRVVIAGRLSF